MICRNCKSTKIKIRSNFSHGSKSKSRTIAICKNCGSADMETVQKRYKRR